VPKAAWLLSVDLATRTPPDEAGAKRWLEQAAQGGVEEARELLTIARRRSRAPNRRWRDWTSWRRTICWHS